MTFAVIVADVAEGDLVGILEYILHADGVQRALDIQDILLDCAKIDFIGASVFRPTGYFQPTGLLNGSGTVEHSPLRGVSGDPPR